MKKCADHAQRIIHNIIPEPVIERIKAHEPYSQDHTTVGVFFATVTNFLDLYEEQFNSGTEFIRLILMIVENLRKLFSNYFFFVETQSDVFIPTLSGFQTLNDATYIILKIGFLGFCKHLSSSIFY